MTLFNSHPWGNLECDESVSTDWKTTLENRFFFLTSIWNDPSSNEEAAICTFNMGALHTIWPQIFVLREDGWQSEVRCDLYSVAPPIVVRCHLHCWHHNCVCLLGISFSPCTSCFWSHTGCLWLAGIGWFDAYVLGVIVRGGRNLLT